MAFCNDLGSSDFGSVFTSSCVNAACSRFKCILQQSIDKHASLITKKIKGRLCPWMSSDVKSEMNLRDQLLRKARRTIAQGFCDFFSTIAGVSETKSFSLCNFVWGKPVNSCETTSPEHFIFSSVSDDEIFRELRNLKRNKSTGLDNLPPGRLKDAATIITKPLAYIINLSLQSGSVPTEWKAAKIIPLFKSGSMIELDNYRPISILPVLSKILERTVYKQLLSHLGNNGLLSSFQFGFRSKRCTELAVSYFTDIIRKEVERAAGRFNLLRRIRPLIDKSSAEKIYKAMIQPVFTY